MSMPLKFQIHKLTTDLQMVTLTLRILYRPLVDNLPHIFTNLGIDYSERVLPSIVNEVLKAVVVRVLVIVSSNIIAIFYSKLCLLICLACILYTILLIQTKQAQYDASELITQREMVSQKVTEELTARAAHFGLVLDDISIVCSGYGDYLSY